MNNPKSPLANLDFRAVLDGLGQGVLLFDSEDRLVLDNLAARGILGPNLILVRSEGWPACAMLLDARRTGGPSVNEIREKALKQTDPIRFSTLLGGAYTPCWAAAIYGPGGKVYTMITMEKPDWRALTELLGTFREESRNAITSTRGHAELIIQLMKKRTPGMTVEQLAQRVTGFAEIMATQMFRLEILMDMLYRLENIRTGQLATDVKKNRKKIQLRDFLEDFAEELTDKPLVDPNRMDDLRDRLTIKVAKDITVGVSPTHLTDILKDLLRNAALYSAKATPIAIQASKVQQNKAIQLDVVDQGYGIRAKEADRIFAPFQRARQPQVIAEFGYGISLYIVKAEIEAMGGRIWYESDEGVGTTFSVKLPAWREISEDEDGY